MTLKQTEEQRKELHVLINHTSMLCLEDEVHRLKVHWRSFGENGNLLLAALDVNQVCLFVLKNSDYNEASLSGLFYTCLTGSDAVG